MEKLKQRLLVTSAIAGAALAVASVSNAQTTVTGNMQLAYKAISNQGSSAKINNARGFGKETQINITNKGKLSNGMDYVAGFSIEHDGHELGTQISTSGPAMFNENVYIDFISGNTTFTIGADHIQNPDYEITNLAGVADLDDIISGVNNSNTAYITSAGSPYTSFGLGLMQNVPNIGRFSAYYAPAGGARAAGDDGGWNTLAQFVDDTNSVYELGFRGDLGVKGLDAGLFYNRVDNNTQGQSNNNQTNYKTTLRYSTGPVSVAAGYAKQEAYNSTAAVSSAALNTETQKKSKSIGAAYAVSKDVSVGLAHGRTSNNLNPSGTVGVSQYTATEKITTLSIGYSLGPVTVGVAAGKVDNVNNLSGIDGDTVMFIAKTLF
jgi:hypothetical protein